MIITLESLIKEKSLEHQDGTYWSSSKKKQPVFCQEYKVRSPSLYNIHQVPATRSWKYVGCEIKTGIMSTFYIVNALLLQTGLGSTQLPIQRMWRVKKADYITDHLLVLRSRMNAAIPIMCHVPSQHAQKLNI